MSGKNISRQKYFVHSAHKSIGVSAGLAALQACDLSGFAGDARCKSTTSLCLVSGSPSYKSDESLLALETYLEKHTRVQCVRAFTPSKDGLPGLENLDRCDCMLLMTRRMEIEGRTLQRIKSYCRRGGPIVAVRTAGHGLQNWPTMDKEVLGGDYQGHYDNETTEVTIVDGAKDHPVLAGVQPFVSQGTLYKYRHIAADARLLLRGSFGICDHSQPVAWTRPHHGGRVFYTSLGHPDDFREPAFLRLLTNAILWATAQQRRSFGG